MTIDTERPADACVGEAFSEPEAETDVHDLPDPRGGEDGATTPGGPRMILIFVSIFSVIFWLRRRHRT